MKVEEQRAAYTATQLTAPTECPVVPFEQVATPQSDRGKRIKQRDYLPEGRIPVIDQGQTPIGGYTNNDDFTFTGELPVVLFGDHTRAVKLVSHRFAVGADGIKIFRPAEGVRPKYLYYWMKSARIPDRGYGRHYQYLRQLSVPLPPPNKQDEIVAEIEKQFSRLDEAVANLKRVKANLKRYKAAVLKAAVEGELTEPETRSAAFNRQNWKPIGFAISSLHQGWSPQCEREPAETDETWAVMKTTAIQPLRFITKENKRLPPALDPRLNLELAVGDLLVTRAGPRSRVGVACLVKVTRPRLMLCDKAYRLRVRHDVAMPGFLEIVLNSPDVLDALDELKTGISDSGVNLTQQRFRELRAPFPPLPEQQRIIAEVERRLSLADEVEAQVNANLLRGERLRQSILARSFQGLPS